MSSSAAKACLTAVDLFAGAGGSTQGLTDAGYTVVAAVENDSDAASTYSRNHAEVQIFEEDIATVSPADLRCALGPDHQEVTLLNACPPCQGFSTLGQVDADDQRNDLVAQVWRFTEELLPRAVLIENVPGLVHNERWKDLSENFEASGYRVESRILDAVDFGVAQRRKRLIAIAIRGALSPFPAELSELLPRSFRLKAKSAREVLALAGSIDRTEDEWHIARSSTKRVLQRLRAIPPGGNHYDLPVELQLPCHRRLRESGRKAATGPYGRIPLDGPAPTLTTRCTTVSCGRFVHPTEDRGISLREAALLQTFPSRYSFAGSYGSVERQIGNAVPARLAQALGLMVKKLLVDQEGITYG